MKVDGACHCGELAYEAEIDPERIGVCHCVDCQILSAYRCTGSASRAVWWRGCQYCDVPVSARALISYVLPCIVFCSRARESSIARG